MYYKDMLTIWQQSPITCMENFITCKDPDLFGTHFFCKHHLSTSQANEGHWNLDVKTRGK